jgi:MoxR-like ATPase
VDLTSTAEAIRTLADNVERVITGKRRAVELAAVALFGGQHLLIEDVPGVGKTMLARAIARSIDGSFSRVQGTSDLLPTDITGGMVFDQGRGVFTFVPGPVFANVVLFDEINRTTPKTQSALLQVMEEHQVASDGVAHDVPLPFFVVGTRNPSEHHGTFPLPEGELDRFGLSIHIGYPDAGAERRVVREQMGIHPIESIEPMIRPEEVAAHQEAVRSVHLEDSVLDYLITVVRATRERDDVLLGASPRGSLSMTRAAQAHALLSGRDYVLPDDVKAVAPYALAHRLFLAPDRPAGRDHARRVVGEVLGAVPAPVDLDGRARGRAS